MKPVVKRAIEQRRRRDVVVRRTRAQQSSNSTNASANSATGESDALENIRKVGEDYKKIKGVDLTPEQENELWDIFKDTGDDGEKLHDWFNKNFPEYVSQKVELQIRNEDTTAESR